MILSTPRRRAVTLVEVLIAIFLMAIGLMAILTLFPLGASQMAQALKDQRCAEAATNAEAMGRVIWKQACDTDVNTGSPKFWDTTAANQRFVYALDAPNTDVPLANQVAGDAALAKTGSTATGPSYPVFVDPIGTFNPPSADRKWWLPAPTGGLPNVRIPRRSLYIRQSATVWSDIATLASGNERIFKQFSLMDDMTFNPSGFPAVTNNTSPVERQGRYTWSYLFRRPNNADRTNVDISTVVYSGRSIDVASPETALLGTAVFPSPAIVGKIATTKQVLLTTRPNIRRGSWILDATMTNAGGALDPQGIFYRVVNIDDSVAGTWSLELQTPIVGKFQATTATVQTTQRAIVVMDNVVEVFTRTNVSPVSPPLPY
jgi:Tfp pilus assembly protein PilV